MKKKRTRNIPIHVRLTKNELEQIKERVAEAGMINRSGFIRRMLFKGYVINIDISFVRELLSLQRRCINYLKQIAAHTRAHEIYIDEITALQKGYDEMFVLLSELLKKITME